MRLFGKKTRVLILGDESAMLGKLRGRVELFWPAGIPVKTLAVFCGWVDEAIDVIRDFRPDVLLLVSSGRETDGCKETATGSGRGSPEARRGTVLESEIGALAR